MKLNIAVYSRSVARGEKSFNLSALFSCCNKNSISVLNFLIKEEYDFEVTEKLLKKPLIIFCEKKDIVGCGNCGICRGWRIDLDAGFPVVEKAGYGKADRAQSDDHRV